jgi:hypothetical protein
VPGEELWMDRYLLIDKVAYSRMILRLKFECRTPGDVANARVVYIKLVLRKPAEFANIKFQYSALIRCSSGRVKFSRLVRGVLRTYFVFSAKFEFTAKLYMQGSFSSHPGASFLNSRNSLGIPPIFIFKFNAVTAPP